MYFEFHKYCPFAGQPVAKLFIHNRKQFDLYDFKKYNEEMLKSGKIPPKPHRWFTEDENLHWYQDRKINEQTGYKVFTDEMRWYGGVTAICLNCGAKTTDVLLAKSVTAEEKDSYDKAFSKDKFNNGEYGLLSGYPIANQPDFNGMYLPDEYKPNYCTKSTEWHKKHKWHTDSDKLKVYSESICDYTMVKGICLLCGAKSDELIINYIPAGNVNRLAQHKEFENSYSKDKFNNGEYKVDCSRYTLKNKVITFGSFLDS
jgi:hypothetical protein